MGRIFAGMFGSVAFLVVILRSLLHGASVEATLERACLAMVVFSAFGGWLGSTAASLIEQSVQKTLEAVFASSGSAPSDTSKPPAG